MSELLPCPFCGGPASDTEVPGGVHFYACDICAIAFESKEEWNRRAPPPGDGGLREAMEALTELVKVTAGTTDAVFEPTDAFLQAHENATKILAALGRTAASAEMQAMEAAMNRGSSDGPVADSDEGYKLVHDPDACGCHDCTKVREGGCPDEGDET